MSANKVPVTSPQEDQGPEPAESERLTDSKNDNDDEDEDESDMPDSALCSSHVAASSHVHTDLDDADDSDIHEDDL